jgi:hypothetical protein
MRRRLDGAIIDGNNVGPKMLGGEFVVETDQEKT